MLIEEDTICANLAWTLMRIRPPGIAGSKLLTATSWNLGDLKLDIWSLEMSGVWNRQKPVLTENSSRPAWITTWETFGLCPSEQTND